MKLVYTLILISLYFSLTAQISDIKSSHPLKSELTLFKETENVSECGTYSTIEDTSKLFYYNNEKIIEDIRQLTQAKKVQLKKGLQKLSPGISTSNIPLYRIPIKVWIYHDDSGMGDNDALSEADTHQLIADVNEHFSNNNTDIEFYLKCDIEHVFSTRLNTVNGDSEFLDMVSTYRETEALNWHLFHSLGSGGDFVGKARFPESSYNFSFVALMAGELTEGRTSTVIHEIGHTLGLLHTHESRIISYNGDADNCFQEAVSRGKKQQVGCVFTALKTKCKVNGDYLCDTDAAPNKESQPSIQLDNQDNCLFDLADTNNKEDNWGDTWTPPVRNFMSNLQYRVCRTEFSPDQISVMQAIIVVKMVSSAWINGGNDSYDWNWYNTDQMTLSGSVLSGEDERYYAARDLTVSSMTVNSGGNALLHAQEQIEVNYPFEVQSNSGFEMATGLVEDCDLIYVHEPVTSSARYRGYQELKTAILNDPVTIDEKELSFESIRRDVQRVLEERQSLKLKK